MCLAKRPALLLLDEPLAALDPVAREGLMRILLSSVAEDGTTVVFSSHAIADLASVCDYLIVLSKAQVHLADDLEYIMASHRILSAPTEENPQIPPGVRPISQRESQRQFEVLARVEEPVRDTSWRISEPTLEEVVLGYLKEGLSEPHQNDLITVGSRAGGK
jgi:ABC-2 type transport system ATP-binding protein